MSSTRTAMPDLEVVRTAELDAPERGAVVDLCTSAHGIHFGELFDLMPADGLHVIARLDGMMVGHAVITTRWLRHGDGPLLRTAYVDAVATARAYQHRGIGSAVMRRLAKVSVADAFEIGCLESEVRGFYESLGWERWRGPLAAQTDAGLVPTPDQDGIFVLRLPATPPLDLLGPLTIKADPRFW